MSRVVRRYHMTVFLAVILSEAKDLPRNSQEILRCAQNDGGCAQNDGGVAQNVSDAAACLTPRFAAHCFHE